MPVSDLLWACPVCGEDRGLRNDRAACRACGTRFLRGAGAAIRAVEPDGAETVRSAAEWLELLPDPSSLLGGDEPIRTARVAIRTATRETKVYGQGGYLNRVEVFGDPSAGTLRLESDRLIIDREGDQREVWPLHTLSAVQTSSKSLQLKARNKPLVAFRFEDDAVFLWERLFRAAIRDLYGRTGRGQIQEFQPRIVTR